MSRTNFAAALMIGSLLLAGCAADPAPPSPEADGVTVADTWVKAAQDGMTAAFGTVTNTSDKEVRLVSATTPAAGRVELHEVVSAGGAMTMRPKEGGFVIPAGAETQLQPGGDHIMLMDLTAPLVPGSDVQITATFEDGSTLPITAQVRDFPGADENYDPHG